MMYPCQEGVFSSLSQAIGNSSAVSIMKVLEITAVALACLSGQVLGRAVSHRGSAFNVFCLQASRLQACPGGWVR